MKDAAVGPVTDVLITHRDHAAYGREYADRFGARLWIHEGDDVAIGGSVAWYSTRPSAISVAARWTSPAWKR